MKINLNLHSQFKQILLRYPPQGVGSRRLARKTKVLGSNPADLSFFSQNFLELLKLNHYFHSKHYYSQVQFMYPCTCSLLARYNFYITHAKQIQGWTYIASICTFVFVCSTPVPRLLHTVILKGLPGRF